MTAENSARSTSAATLYIDGAWRAAALGREFDVFNPADGSVLGAASDGSASEARSAVDAAAAAFAGGRARPPTSARRTCTRRTSSCWSAREALAKLMTEEQGKPIRMARNEVGYAADFLLWFAEEAKRVYGETIPSARADQRFLVMRQPVGVVGAITPWNYPVSMLTRKIGAGARRRLHDRAEAGRADAAAARSRCSRSSTTIGVPAGVVNLVTTRDPAPVGDELVDQPGGAQDHLHRLHRGRQAASRSQAAAAA